MIVNGVIIQKDKNKIIVGEGLSNIKKYANGLSNIKKANGLKSVKGGSLKILK